MTGFKSKREAAMDKEAMTRPLESDYNSQVAYTRALEAYCDSLAQPEQEPRNFCPRCGKRTADLTAVHTCTPPRGLETT